jgi:hypothetical protein
MLKTNDCIPVGDCVDRHVYRIRSRNLRIGVFCAKEKGFLGIRTKFNDRYVFTEYHYDNGPPYGTVCPLEDLGLVLPDDVPLLETLPGSWDSVTGREVKFDRPISDGGRGWYFLDTNEADQNIRAQVKANHALFQFLEEVEAKHD